VEVVASLSQGRTATAQCGLFTHKSVPVIFEPPCILLCCGRYLEYRIEDISEVKNIAFVKCVNNGKLSTNLFTGM